QNGLAFVDVNSLLNDIATGGVAFDEFFLNASLVFGGAFSLDGIHPTARGYAYLANQFMSAIDATYGSTLPHVKARDFNTLYPTSM
ncbi:MAG TPA: G-D-S-L family lipolytic protein, partial [Flavobacteriaceae bacterium]|nr:G-D-S-L family lipolytic protein [Flavobacteriaceae bacterium]